MKRASYREAVEWIAEMDSAGCDDADNPEAVALLITSQLIADIFRVDAARVGCDVVRHRAKIDQRERNEAAYDAEIANAEATDAGVQP